MWTVHQQKPTHDDEDQFVAWYSLERCFGV
jgi:hypothetical protein